MERLTINIPDKKGALVKRILEGLGVTFQPTTQTNPNAYKQKLTEVSTWSDEDLKIVEDSKKAFGNFEPEQW